MAKRPTQRQLFRELAAKFGPEIAQAFRAALQELRSGVEVQKLILAIGRGDLAGAMDALHIDRSAFAGLEEKLAEAYAAGGRGAVASMPLSVSIGFRFDPGNQRAASWIRQHAARLITGLVENEREQARQHIAAGMTRGTPPRSVALDLVGRINRATGRRDGGLIGLSGPQRGYAEAARAELLSGDAALLKNYLGRARRDKRFDRTVTKALREGRRVAPETVASMITAYERRLIQHRGEVIARTEALPAIRAAKREAYQQLVDDGRVDAMSIVRGWSAVGDSRTRDTHADMNGQEVRGLDAPFVSPSGAAFLYPGDTSLGAPAAEVIACRCDEFIAIRRWPL